MIPVAQLASHFFVLAIALLGTGMVQLLSVRLSGGKIGVVLSLFLGFVAGAGLLAVGELMVTLRGPGLISDSLGLAAANGVLFVCLWYFYFHFINIGEASLRIRVLREAERCSGQPLDALLAVYNVRTVVTARMERLVRDGQLILEGERFRPGKSRMVIVAKAFSFLRWLLLGQAANRSEQG